MTTAFVTGATGFIGAHLTRALIDYGHHVKVLSRQSTPQTALWSTDEVDVVTGDLLAPEQWKSALETCDFVFHTAGEVRDEARMQSINVTGTQNLLDACANTKIKHIVHLSSVGVIGANRAGDVDETEPTSPFNPYEVSKWEAEKVVTQWQAKNDIPVAMLRPTVVYGEHARSTLILFWLKLAKRGVVLTIGKDPIANYVYVADVMNACLLTSQSHANGTYIVGNPILLREFIAIGAEALGSNVRSLPLPKWIAKLVARVITPLLENLGKTSPWTPQLVDALALRSRYVATKLGAETGWTPTSHQVGLARTIEWYIGQKLL